MGKNDIRDRTMATEAKEKAALNGLNIRSEITMLLRLIIPEGPTIFHPSRVSMLRGQSFAVLRSSALECKYRDLVFTINSTDLVGRAGFSSSNLL